MNNKILIGIACFFILTIMAITFPNSTKSQVEKNDQNKSATFFSKHLDAEIISTVFTPEEAEAQILPYMKDHAKLFKGKTVLDIGTGSGIIALYAAKLGAKKVIATDICKNALLVTSQNAQKLKLSNIIETRYVSPEDITAYAVIEKDETFDIIISNPPYSLDLEATQNSAIIDSGDLGISLIKGLKTHLNSDGTVILLYKSFFYHQTIVNLSKYLGFVVKNYTPMAMTIWEADAVFNSYLMKLLNREQIDPTAFKFNSMEDRNIFYYMHQGKAEIKITSEQYDPNQNRYEGIIIIRSK